MAGGIYSYLLSRFFTPPGVGWRGMRRRKKLQDWWSQEVMTRVFLMEGTRAGTREVGTSSWAVSGFVTAFIFMIERGKYVAGRKGNHIKLQREGSYRSCVPKGCFLSYSLIDLYQPRTSANFSCGKNVNIFPYLKMNLERKIKPCCHRGQAWTNIPDPEPLPHTTRLPFPGRTHGQGPQHSF